MSSLAKILIAEGHIVKGVDVEEDFYTNKGIYGMESFNAYNLKSYYYIIGNAYINHKIVTEIKKRRYYYKNYPSFLVEHFNKKKWICVSGSHGKTTTTKLISHILDDCIALIGDGDFNYGNGQYFVLESCEYRDTFLNYSPNIGLVLNVDYDHPDYFKTEKDYRNSFISFINNCNTAIVNGDDFIFKENGVISYGINMKNDVIFEYQSKDTGIVRILNKPFYLPTTGLYFAYDFVGAYLVCKLLNMKDIEIQNKLSSFKFPKRRMEIDYLNNQVIVCDYAHHPTEIRAVFLALKEKFINKEIIVVFEPHTISRLETYFKDFNEALSLFDECYLFPIFSSVREGKNGSKENDLYRKLNYVLYDDEVVALLKNKTDSVICFLGAGVIDKECEKYKLNQL